MYKKEGSGEGMTETGFHSGINKKLTKKETGSGMAKVKFRALFLEKESLEKIWSQQFVGLGL